MFVDEFNGFIKKSCPFDRQYYTLRSAKGLLKNEHIMLPDMRYNYYNLGQTMKL